MYVRLPGIITFSAFAWCAWISGVRDIAPTWVAIAQVLLNSFNGIYFADRVVANTAVAEYKASLRTHKSGHNAIAETA